MALLADGALSLYRLTSILATPLVRRHLRRRMARGREHPERLMERFGVPGIARPATSVVWLHAASVGEATSLLPLIVALQEHWPAKTLLLTTGTVTSAKVMAERLPPGVLHQFVPVDCAPFVSRFLDHWQPDALIVAESEIWPNILRQAKERRVALALVNSRISEKSLAGWQRLAPVARQLFGLFDIVLAQSEEDSRRLVQLGAKTPRYVGNLKQAAYPPPADIDTLAAYRSVIGDRPRWLAASTHPGEEDMVAQAHRHLAEGHPGLLTILAPRHPDRGPELTKSLHQQGLTVTLRSQGRHPTPDTDIYIADTIGEMGLWYRLSDIVFVGGSLISGIGGHNPLEAAKLDSAVICGPYVANCAAIVEEMTRRGAIRQVTDSAALATTVADLLATAATCQAMVTAARNYGADQNQVVQRSLSALEPLLAPEDTLGTAGIEPAVS